MINSDYFLIVIGNLTYPSGNAPSNRIHAYSKGLIEMNKNVLVINTAIVSNIKTRNIRNYENVDYIYPLAGFKRKNLFQKRIIGKMINLIKPIYSIRILLRIRNKSKNFAILEFSSTFYQEIIYWCFAKIYGIPIIREANEIPYHKERNNFLIKLKLFIYKKIRIHLYDGIIVISNLLEDFYQRYCKQNVQIIKIPILVDFKRFDSMVKNNKYPYIAYVGSMDEKKDGVISLIKAFSLITNQVQDYKLVLIGSVNKKNKKKIIKLAKKEQIENKIILKGFVEKDKVPELLFNAKILALARPNSRQNAAGFPTKLGEYLATGNPVVATQIGDIELYLKHNVSILLSPPGNINDFANNMLSLIKKKKFANVIGINGKNVAKQYFYYRKYTTSLNNFINKLLY